MPVGNSERIINMLKKLAYLFEVGANIDDLMNKIFNWQDVILSESSFNNSVIGEGDALFINFAISTLVDQLADGLKIRLA